MAETLNVTGDAASMLGKRLEYKRKNRWILEIDGIDVFLCKTAGRPSITFADVTIDWINIQRKISGKGSWSDISLTLYDALAPSAAQQVMEWVRLNVDYTTGRANYTDFYKKDIVLKMLDPVGTVVERWDIIGAWPSDANFGDLDYAAGEPCEVALTLKYDYAILQF